MWRGNRVGVEGMSLINENRGEKAMIEQNEVGTNDSSVLGHLALAVLRSFCFLSSYG
jgi:hypothetical protein